MSEWTYKEERDPDYFPWMLIGFVILCVTMMFSSCTIDEAYISADRDNYNVIAPAHKTYVEADANLTQEQKDRRLDKLKTWLIRIEKAEAK